MASDTMTSDTVDLKSEERRRQFTVALLGGLLFATTLPVVNQRALFSPLGDIPILGDLSPVAYAATFGTPAGDRPRPGVPRGDEGPPGAFGARTPGDPAGNPPGIPSTPPGAGSPSATPPGIANPSDPASSQGGGNPVPGGGGGGGGPGGGGGTGGGGSPPNTGNGGIPTPGGGGGNPSTPGVVGAVPEPATWLTMIFGFAVIGGIMRRARRLGGVQPVVVSGS